MCHLSNLFRTDKTHWHTYCPLMHCACLTSRRHLPLVRPTKTSGLVLGSLHSSALLLLPAVDTVRAHDLERRSSSVPRMRAAGSRPPPSVGDGANPVTFDLRMCKVDVLNLATLRRTYSTTPLPSANSDSPILTTDSFISVVHT